jgi:hypothetical protein
LYWLSNISLLQQLSREALFGDEVASFALEVEDNQNLSLFLLAKNLLNLTLQG